MMVDAPVGRVALGRQSERSAERDDYRRPRACGKVADAADQERPSLLPSRPDRICLLTSEYLPQRGGIGSYAREISRAAAALGAEVTVWAPDYGRRWPADERDEDLRVRRFAGGVHSAREVPRKLLATLGAALSRYDIVHAADWPFFLPVALLPQGRAVRKVVTLHGTEIIQMSGRARRTVLRLARWPSQIDTVLCNSHFTRDRFVETFGASAAKAKVTLLGVSRFWLTRVEREPARQAQGLRPDDLAVITVGRLTHRKGHLTTLAALAQLPPGLRDRVVWLVVGATVDDDYVRDLRQAIATSDVRAKVLGERSDADLRELYAAADLFVLTGHQHGNTVEGFGLVYLEAGAAGVPAVATSTGGVPDAVRDGETGLLVEPASGPAITAALARCLGDDQFRHTLSGQARAFATRMSWARCAADSYGLPQSGQTDLP